MTTDRRNFIGSILKVGAAFAVLPAAATYARAAWKASMPVVFYGKLSWTGMVNVPIPVTFGVKYVSCRIDRDPETGLWITNFEQADGQAIPMVLM